MAVQIPPWLNIDPIAPARIRLQANAQRDAAAASERTAQSHAEELQFRREHAANQAAQEEAQSAAQERAAIRRDQVLKQTNDRELAHAAQQMQLHREEQAQKANQFQQTLRMKQQAAEVQAKNAAQQMQGMQALQKGLQEGRPMQELLAENAPMLFSGRADRAVGALQRGAHIAPVPDYVAHELKDEQGNPIGVKVRRGAGNSIVPLPRTEMSPEGRMKQDQLLANIYGNQLKDATGEEETAIKKKLSALRDRIEKDIEQRGTLHVPGPLPPRTPAVVPPISPAASPSDTVQVKSPDGKPGVIPRAKWESYTEAQKKGWEEIAPMSGESDFTEESDSQTSPDDTGGE